MKYLSIILFSLLISVGYSPLGAQNNDDDIHLYQFDETDYDSTFDTSVFPVSSTIDGKIGIIYKPFTNIVYFILTSKNDKALQALIQDFTASKYTMTLSFDDHTKAENCFIKIAKLSPTSVRINYYPSDADINPEKKFSNSAIIEKLTNKDIEEIKIHGSKNSYTISMKEIYTSIILSDLYSWAMDDDMTSNDDGSTTESNLLNGLMSLGSSNMSSTKTAKKESVTTKTQTSHTLTQQSAKTESDIKSKTTEKNFSTPNKSSGQNVIAAIDLVKKKCGLFDNEISWQGAKVYLLAKDYNTEADNIQVTFTCPFSYEGITPTCTVFNDFKNTTFRFKISGNEQIRRFARLLTEDLKTNGVKIEYIIDHPEKLYRSYGTYDTKNVSITTNSNGVFIDIF